MSQYVFTIVRLQRLDSMSQCKVKVPHTCLGESSNLRMPLIIGILRDIRLVEL